MSEVEDFFQGQQQQARIGLASSMDDDPETAARSLDLSEATGVPATAIYGDTDGFERQHKAALGSQIVQNNTHIADYLSSHPLAPRLSHDDLGQLDVASQAMSKLPEKSGLQRVHEALKIGSLAEKAFPGDPLAPYKEFGLSRPQDIEWAARNPELSAMGIGVASLVGYPFLFAGQILGGATNLINEFGGRQAASMFEYGLMRGDIRAPGTGGFGDVEAIGQSMRAAAPWLRAGKGAPTRIDATLDKLKADQAKSDSDVLSEALAESVKSATRERNADFYANFARLHLGDREIGIPADAIRDLYGDKVPSPGDNLFGWISDIEGKLSSAEATGGDVKIPLADWLAKVDPEVAKELKDHIRARPNGVTIEEGKLASENTPKKIETYQLSDTAIPLNPQNVIVHLDPSKVQPLLKPMDRAITPEKLAGAKEFLESNPASWNPSEFEIRKNQKGEDRVGIIDGVHRWQASRERGMSSIPTEMSPKAAKEAERLGLVAKPQRIEGSIIPESLPLVRGSAGLEPMFSVGDRKVKLDNRISSIAASKYGVGFHDFDLVNELGNKIGAVNISEQQGGKQLYIEMIQAGKSAKMYDPNFLGPALIRDLLRQLKQEFPNAESITGHRVSGAREKADSYMKPSASPVIKFDDLGDATKWSSFHDKWQTIQKGVYGKSIEMTPEKQKVVNAVNTILDRIVPKAVGVEGFEQIRDEAGGKKGGVYSRYEDSLPWISWSLESSDAVATARHEAIHHLRNYGFFKEGEWDTLSRAARDGDWVKQYRIDERYADQKLSNSEKLEESIADAYKNWARGKEAPNGTIQAIFERIKEILESIKTSLKEAFGKDLTAEELFKKVESGEVGGREPTGPLDIHAYKESVEQFRRGANDNTKKLVEDTSKYDKWSSELDRRSKELDEAISRIDWSEGGMTKLERTRIEKLQSEWEDIFHKGFEQFDPDRPRFENLEPDISDIGGKEAEKLRERISELRGELQVAKDTAQPIDAAKQSELKELRERLRSTTSGTFNMTVDQYQRYMKLIERRHSEDLEAAQKSALDQQRKQQTKEWKENRTAIRDEVREELSTDPNLTVDQLMTSEKVKFHPDFLSDEQKAMLPKEYIQKKNGINPDDVAGYFGYVSGDALVERLALTTHDRLQAGMSSREWMNHLIDSETDRRMEQRHGNLDQKILEEAKDQAISETQLDLLHEEVLYLGLKAGSEFPISKTQLRAWNKELFDKTPISAITTDEYLRAAGKAGKAAEMSLLEEDFANAFREKQRQNNAMIMANYAKQYEKARKSFDRTAKVFQKREVPSVPQEWTNWVHDILQRTGNRVNRSVQDLAENINRQSEKTLQEFVEAKEAETFSLRETPVADFLLESSFRSEMGKLTAEQFYGLKQSIDVLAKQGRDEKKIYAQGEAAEREVVLSEMRDKLATFPAKVLPDEAPTRTALLKLPRLFMAGMTNIETLLNRWDRADPRGIFNRYLTYPLTRAANHKASLEREYAKAYGDLGPIKDGDKFVDAPFADPLSRSETDPEGRPWPGFTRKHVLAMLQNAGNKSNWRVLARGYSADPEALMSWLHRNTTKEDWDRAQKMGSSLFHSLVDKADTVYENLTGATIEKISLEPIDTPYGTYKGWYHPLIADPLRKEVWVKNEDTGIWQRNATGSRGSVMDDSDYFHASTANGYTKRRTGAVYPLDLNFDVVPSRIKQMIHDIAFRQVIVEAEKVFGNKSFQAEVTKHYGSTYTDLLMPYLKSMAGAESIPSKAGAEAARVSEYLRQNTISTYIGFNPYTALKHGPTAAIMSSREVGTANFLSAVKSLYGQSADLSLSNSEFAMKHSEELQRRERHWQDTIAGEHKQIEGASTLREKIIEKGSWLVAQSDMLSAKPTWIAQYNKSIADGLSHGESIDLADRAVRRAHGSTAQTNQPAMVRGGGPLHGWLTSVYGFFGTAMQRRIEIAHTLNDTYQLGKEGEIKAAAKNIPKLSSDIFTYVIWPTIVEEWVTGLTTEDKRGWGTHLLSGATMGLASSILYIRDLVHAFSTGHDPGVGLLSSPLHDVANVVRDARRGKEAFNRQHAGKTVGDALTVFGEATGMAPKTIGNAARFGIDLVNKQQHPRTGPEWLRGFTRGTAKKREEK